MKRIVALVVLVTMIMSIGVSFAGEGFCHRLVKINGVERVCGFALNWELGSKTIEKKKTHAYHPQSNPLTTLVCSYVCKDQRECLQCNNTVLKEQHVNRVRTYEVESRGHSCGKAWN